MLRLATDQVDERLFHAHFRFTHRITADALTGQGRLDLRHSTRHVVDEDMELVAVPLDLHDSGQVASHLAAAPRSVGVSSSK